MAKTVHGKWFFILRYFPVVYGIITVLLWGYQRTIGSSEISATSWLVFLVPIVYHFLIIKYTIRLYGRHTAYIIGLTTTFVALVFAGITSGQYNIVHEYGMALFIMASALMGYMPPLVIISLIWLNFFIEATLRQVDWSYAVTVALFQSAVGFVGWIWMRHYYIQEDQELESLRHTLRDEKLQSEALIRAIDGGIMVIDKKGITQHCNSAMLKILGIEQDSVYAQPYTAVFSNVRSISQADNHTKTPISIVRDTLEDNIAKKVDLMSLRRKDSTSVDITFRITPLMSEDREVTSHMIVAYDISQLARVQRMKDEFISVASHELRTPMTVIAGYADLLLKSPHVKKLPEAEQNKIERIKSSTVRLIELVNDMLDLSKLESKTIEDKVTTVRVKDLCNDIVQDLSRHYADKGLELSSNAHSVSLNIDEAKLRRVIVNFLSNAYKFTPRGGTVTIEVAQNDDGVEIGVRDTGGGIVKDEQEKIFEKFSRAKGHENIEGTGLGLAICREIISSWDSDIQLQSQEGQGSYFYFTLPSAMISNTKNERGNNENHDN